MTELLRLALKASGTHRSGSIRYNDGKDDLASIIIGSGILFALIMLLASVSFLPTETMEDPKEEHSSTPFHLLVILLTVVGVGIYHSTPTALKDPSAAGSRIRNEDSALPAHVSMMNKELGRGRKYLGALSGNDLAQQMSEMEADVSQAKREGWCITAAGCRDGYVCGLPNAIGLTTGYTEEFTGPMGVRRAAQGGSRIKENTIIAHICSTPYCLKETKAEYRSMINRMKQGNNVTIHGPEFRVWDL
jgi:hypothetical protein